MSHRPFVILALLAAAAAPAPAQDVVRMKGGEVVVGRVRDGMLEVEVESVAGAVRVPWSRIEGIDRAEKVRELHAERVAALPAGDAGARFTLALWCRRQGLAREMEAALREVLTLDPEHPGARAALGYEKVEDRWVAGENLLAAKGFVRRGERWVLAEEAAHEEMARERDRALTPPEAGAAELLARGGDPGERVRAFAAAALRAKTWAEVRVPAYRALGDRDPAVRAFAAAELGRRGESEAVRPLLRSAVLDTSEPVREAATAALRAIRAPGTVLPLARALTSSVAAVRMNAAAAIGGYGDVRGVEYLVTTLAQNWGPTQRNNLSVVNQVSYVQDFDVEIAQAAQIGDPIVSVLREGVILDFRVLGASRVMTVAERRIIRSALSRLTGQDLGEEAGPWAAWWAANRERLLAEAR